MLALERHFENKTHIIWDWNGTLIDDAHVCVEVMSSILREHQLPELTLERYRALFRLPVVSYYEELGFDLQAVSFDKLARDFVKRYRENVFRCSLFPGASELLASLKARGKCLSVLSAAYESELKELITHYGIEHCFDYICGLSDIYAVSKVQRGRELMAYWKIAPSSIILVGDMDHDAEVGRELGIDVLVLGDGHQSYDRLKDTHPLVVESRNLI